MEIGLFCPKSPKLWIAALPEEDWLIPFRIATVSKEMEMQEYLMAGANESDEVSETVRNVRNSRTWGTSENLILFMALPYRCHLFRIPFQR
ncbi:hypothetical protein CEXT_495171 [Caerostris extrusa]|uniref:Uncharacterized protein n=1 Tax=Caerostris extrusa TaxID=172846 RepID=A0AAV4WTQ1_CAEEX|nr:hypothetical protein CEXT_495171 [Caerostris extrusa]